MILLMAIATASHAQRVTPVAEGSRIRVTAPQLPAPLFGRVLIRDRNTDVLVVTTPGADARVTLPLTAVQRIDVSSGRRRVAGAAVGAAVGILIGGAFGAAQAGDDGIARTAGFLAGGFAGIVFGGPIGFVYAPERWHRGIVADALDDPIRVDLRAGARVKRFADDTVAVKGERDRKRGIIRGAIIVGGIGLIFGGIDARKGELSGQEYVGTVVGNTLLGGAAGYLLSPRGWQRLPAPRQGRSTTTGSASVSGTQD